MRVLTFLFVLFCCSLVIAHEDLGDFCIHDRLHDSLPPAHKEYYNSMMKVIRNQEPSLSERMNPLYVVPVVWHVIHDGSAPSLVSMSTINQEMAWMNEWFSATNLHYNTADPAFDGVNAEAEDIEIQFVLAGFDLNGDPTDGVNLILSSSVANSCDENNAYDSNVGGATLWDPTLYMNVITCDIDIPGAPGVAGFSYLPFPNNPNDGTVMDFAILGRTDYAGAILAHETGHWLGLPHTFPGSPSCSESAGDNIVDTPATDAPYSAWRTNNNCVNIVNPNCALTTMVQNVMDYSPASCYAVFSKGQVGVMRGWLGDPNSLRGNLITSPGLPCTPQCDGRECGDNQCGGVCGTCGAQEACDGNGLCQCTPNCNGLECGDDGCGGECGPCAGQNDICVAGACCTPDCNGIECGDDTCGGTCGVCPNQSDVCLAGACCSPQCDGRECGDDTCSGVCGTCEGQETCDANGICQSCTPNCDGKECGDDGCGGECGPCSGPDVCNENFECVCISNCDGRVCGSDGCSGTCGTCNGFDTCDDINGVCIPCEPQCDGKECGDDQCGGDCGPCAGANDICTANFACECAPDCEGRNCGDDSCGGSCGTCTIPGETCGEGVCGCDPVVNCAGKECGDDQCGGQCGPCPNQFDTCDLEKFECIPCVPDCDGRTCGDDGCGGSCGSCTESQHQCQDGDCVCVGDCVGKQCGDDGCGNACGACISPEVCTDDLCICQSDCGDRKCGVDICGAPCGTCEANEICNDAFECECVRQCTGRQCGSDGCNGVCGTCRDNQECSPNFECVCSPNCVGKICGDDGCGGSCGSCASNAVCNNVFQCECVPDCNGKQCGSDGCGGQCGQCLGSTACGSTFQCDICVPSCAGKQCGSDGCSGTCGGCEDGQYCVAGDICAFPDGVEPNCSRCNTRFINQNSGSVDEEIDGVSVSGDSDALGCNFYILTSPVDPLTTPFFEILVSDFLLELYDNCVEIEVAPKPHTLTKTVGSGIEICFTSTWNGPTEDICIVKQEEGIWSCATGTSIQGAQYCGTVYDFGIYSLAVTAASPTEPAVNTISQPSDASFTTVELVSNTVDVSTVGISTNDPLTFNGVSNSSSAANSLTIGFVAIVLAVMALI